MRLDRNNASSQILSSVTVRGAVATPSATISASPNPCTLATASGSCTSTIAYSSTNAPNAGLFFGSTLVGGGSSGTYTPSWINSAGFTFDVRLDRNNASSQILNSVTVRGAVATPSATISASPNPCALTTASATCTSTITYSSTNAPNAGLFFGSTLVGGGSSGTYTPTWINSSGFTFDVRVDRNNANSSVLASVFVNGQVSATQLSCASVAPQATSTSAVSGFFRVYAYGVTNATSVRFPTWGDTNGQNDLVWYNGVNAGGGTWYADVNLANHLSGAPEYGNFNTHVYLNNASQSNKFCAAMTWTRTHVSVPPYAATFVSQTVPTAMTAGASYNVSITMKNTGSNTWTTADGYKLGSANPNDNTRWGLQRVALPGSVPPNGQAIFNFTVTAPATAGSYNFQWQMLREGVQWIGATTTNLQVQVNPQSVAVGVIRWDYGWGRFGSQGTGGAWDYQFNLIDKNNRVNSKWASRWPFYTDTSAEYPISLREEIAATTGTPRIPSTIEQENRYAKDAGISYWAFVYYGLLTGSDQGDYGLNRYKTSNSYKPQYALILGWYDQPYVDKSTQRAMIVTEMQSSTYYKLANGQPLLYLLDSSWGTPLGIAEINAISNAYANSNGGVRPYLVYQANTGNTKPTNLSVDACTTYASIDPQTSLPPNSTVEQAASAPARPYLQLASAGVQIRDSWVASLCEPVPPIMAGWDPSPRWVRFSQGSGGFNGLIPPGNPAGDRYEIPTTTELNNHLFDAIQWVRTRPSSSPKTVLIYAWNEFDEGGWLAPRYNNGAAPDTSRLDAVKRAIQGIRD